MQLPRHVVGALGVPAGGRARPRCSPQPSAGRPRSTASTATGSRSASARAPTRAARVPCERRGSSGRSPPARPAGSPRRAWSTSTGTAGWRSSRRSTRRSCSTRRDVSWAGARRARAGSIRPSVVTDLEGDGVADIVVAGNAGTVAAYEFRGGGLHLKAGWPASTDSGGQSPEARGLAAADLDGDGRVEVVATTTNTSPTGAQVFVFDANGRAVPAEGRPLPRLAPLQPARRAGQRPAVQRGRQPRLRRVRRERRHRQHRRRHRPGDHHHLRQPPDQRLQPRRHVDPRLALVHQPASPTPTA